MLPSGMPPSTTGPRQAGQAEEVRHVMDGPRDPDDSRCARRVGRMQPCNTIRGIGEAL
jgi:hypothetical protein